MYAESNFDFPIMYDLNAVSYTHLDVYKRQILHSGPLASIVIPTIFSILPRYLYVSVVLSSVRNPPRSMLKSFQIRELFALFLAAVIVGFCLCRSFLLLIGLFP